MKKITETEREKSLWERQQRYRHYRKNFSHLQSAVSIWRHHCFCHPRFCKHLFGSVQGEKNGKVFFSPSFVVLPPWRSIDAKPLSVQILIRTSGIIFGLWMIYQNLFLKICQKLDLWLPNILMPILYDELVINWITVNYLMKNLCTVLIGDILPLNSICYNSMTSKKAVENGGRLKPMTAIKLCWTYIYIYIAELQSVLNATFKVDLLDSRFATLEKMMVF